MFEKIMKKLNIEQPILSQPILLENIREDEELRTIMNKQLDELNGELGLKEDKVLVISNIKELTVANIQNTSILLEQKEQIEFAKPMSVECSTYFYNSVLGKKKLKNEMKKFTKDLFNVKKLNWLRAQVKDNLETINKSHDGILSYKIQEELSDVLYLQLLNENNKVLTNIRLQFPGDYNSMLETLSTTKVTYIEKRKQEIVELYLHPIDETFDVSRIEFGKEFNYILGNGVVTIPKDESNLTELKNLVKLEKYIKNNFSMVVPYLEFINCKLQVVGFDKESGIFGANSEERHAKELAFFLMSLLKQYTYIQCHPYITDIPFEPSTIEWCKYNYSLNKEEKEITLSFGNDKTYEFKYDEANERIII